MRKDQARAELMAELKTLQEDLRENWVGMSLPEDWDGLDSALPLKRRKTRVTLRLDSDMVAWFRKLGPGYGPRLNHILRIYWLSLLSGRIKSHWDEEALSPRFADYVEQRMARLREEVGE